MLATFFSISRISTARRPSGFEIRCKKISNLLNPGICNPVNKQKRSELQTHCCDSGSGINGFHLDDHENKCHFLLDSVRNL